MAWAARVRTVAAIAAAVVVAAPALAGGDTSPARPASDTGVVRARDDTRAQRLFGELMSPFCPGLTLATCPSPGADSLRRDIRARLDRGETPTAIRGAYAAAWGERMLGAPPFRSWGALLWLAPGAALALGAVGLVLWLRSLRRRSAAGPGGAPRPEPSAAPDERRLTERLAAELKAFDERR
jgi:cytochrome c-type biogenesis protein CcmH